MWIVWTGGNDRFWDAITDYSFGAFDLLKIVSSHPDKGMQHLDRTRAGTISAWSTSPASTSRPARTRSASACGSTSAAPTARPTPSRTSRSTRACRIGARGGNVPVGSYYG